MPVYGRTHPLAYVYGDTYICIYAGIRGHASISVRIRIHQYMHICQYTGARAPLAYACGFPYACICTCMRTPVDPVPPMLQLPPRIYKPLDTQPYTPISLYTRTCLYTLSFASTPTVYIFFWAPNATVGTTCGHTASPYTPKRVTVYSTGRSFARWRDGASNGRQGRYFFRKPRGSNATPQSTPAGKQDPTSAQKRVISLALRLWAPQTPPAVAPKPPVALAAAAAMRCVRALGPCLAGSVASPAGIACHLVLGCASRVCACLARCLNARCWKVQAMQAPLLGATAFAAYPDRSWVRAGTGSRHAARDALLPGWKARAM